MIPSPVNLSTVPSKRRTPSESSAKKRCMIRRHSSGSVCSAMSIEPFTSANRTVTCLRSPSGSEFAGGVRWARPSPRPSPARRSCRSAAGGVLGAALGHGAARAEARSARAAEPALGRVCRSACGRLAPFPARSSFMSTNSIASRVRLTPSSSGVGEAQLALRLRRVGLRLPLEEGELAAGEHRRAADHARDPLAGSGEHPRDRDRHRRRHAAAAGDPDDLLGQLAERRRSRR